MTPTTKKQKVTIYSDGACSGNPGPGGYGTILRCPGKGVEKILSGGESKTTNNRMELMGAIAGLESLKRPLTVTVISDSQYLVKGITEWIGGWQSNGWRTSGKKNVLNRDLWQRLLAAVEPHKVNWKWVRGHVGHEYNERCDEIARREIDKHR